MTSINLIITNKFRAMALRNTMQAYGFNDVPGFLLKETEKGLYNLAVNPIFNETLVRSVLEHNGFLSGAYDSREQLK